MNLNRYEFSTKSYPALINFLKAVEECPDNNDNSEHWKSILPKNKTLLAKLNANTHEDQIIDLTSEHGSAKSRCSEASAADKNESVFNNSTIENMLTDITAILTSEKNLSKHIITAINTDFTNKQIDELFMQLVDILDIDSVYKFGKALIDHRECKLMVVSYFRFLLFQKLIKDDSKETAEFFDQFLNEFLDIISRELSVILINQLECSKALYVNLRNLQLEHKRKIFRDFILKCSKFKEAHFKTLEAILVKESDLGITKKLIDMFVSSASDFNSDKSFGKLLLTVIQNMERNINYFEPQLRNIVANHRSPWKKKILEYLECSILHTQSFSQTMHF